MLFTACTSTGDGVVQPVDRTTSLLEALAASPTGAEPEKESVVEIPRPVVIHEDESVAEKPQATDTAEDAFAITAPEPEPVSDIPPVTESADVVAAEEEDGNVVIPFAEETEEEVVEIIPAPAAVDEDAAVVPVSGDAEEAESVIYPVVSEELSVLEEDTAPWMLRLMIILVIVLILFTAASAIRNAYNAPLNRIVSLAIAALLTALSWILSYLIAGPSLLYLVYLSLLFTYFVLRSTKRSRHE